MSEKALIRTVPELEFGARTYAGVPVWPQLLGSDAPCMAENAARLAELRPLEARWLKRVAELRGAPHARLEEYRWLLEELRVSLFAQELRTPQPVSARRLDKAWAQIDA
jgi:hypothetical protein